METRSDLDHDSHELERHIVTLQRWHTASREELAVDEDAETRQAIEALADVAIRLGRRRGYVRRVRRPRRTVDRK